MSEHLRALVVVMGLALPFWYVASRYAVPALMTAQQFSIRTRLWVFISLAAFLSYNYWIFTLFVVVLLVAWGTKDDEKSSLFLFLFLAIPPFYATVSGFGLLNYLIELNYYRLLVLVVLLPAWLTIDVPRDRKLGSTLVDWAVIGLGLLYVFDSDFGQGFTYSLRQGTYWFIDVFLPYRCMVILNQRPESVTKAMHAFVLGVMVLALIGIFESLKGWLLYKSLPGSMGLYWGMGNYMERSGLTRAITTAGHPIIFGFLVVVALAFFACTSDALQSKWSRRLALLLLVGGLLTSMSRGPWVGAAAVLLVWIFTGGATAKRIKVTTMVVAPVTLMLLVSPMRDKVFNLIPFLGQTNAETVSYREDLFWVAVDVIATSPWLGPPQYYAAPQMQSLVQGEGIIDIVNSYIGYGLAHGLVGLTLFCGAFAACGWYVIQTMRNRAVFESSAKEAAALLAALVGVLITIATTSSMDAIPMTYWMLAGMCVAHHRNCASPHAVRDQKASMGGVTKGGHIRPQRGW